MTPKKCVFEAFVQLCKSHHRLNVKIHQPFCKTFGQQFFRVLVWPNDSTRTTNLVTLESERPDMKKVETGAFQLDVSREKQKNIQKIFFRKKSFLIHLISDSLSLSFFAFTLYVCLEWWNHETKSDLRHIQTIREPSEK